MLMIVLTSLVAVILMLMLLMLVAVLLMIVLVILVAVVLMTVLALRNGREDLDKARSKKFKVPS